MGVFKPVVLSLLMLVGIKSAASESGTSFTFNSFQYPAANGNNLTYQGDAHVPKETNFLRLTKTNDSGVPGVWSTGRVLYTKPVLIRGADFDTTIKFTILPSKFGAADGIAFFMAPVDSTIQYGGGSFAVYDSSGVKPYVFSVEFDTYSNVWDPNYRHIGINLYSIISYNLTEFDSATGDKVTARITYVESTSTVTVVATSGSQNATLTLHVVNFSNLLPKQVQVGIASSTGGPAANDGVHDIYSWSFTSNTSANLLTHQSM